MGKLVPKYISFNAHARDCQDVFVKDKDGRTLLDHNGYSLETPISERNGDNLTFTVDIETGKILNWDPNIIYQMIDEYEHEDRIEDEEDEDSSIEFAELD